MIGTFKVIVLFLFFMLGLFSFYSIFSLIKTWLSLKKLDELQRVAIYESLAISFVVVLVIHFIQSLAVVLAPEPWSTFASTIISPGPYKGAFMTNSPLHWDSFIMDCVILSIVYYIKRKKYELI